MDFTESTRVVYNRIQILEPENVSKIIGYLLLQDHGEREMIRLAFSPDNLIHSLINKAKTELGLSKPAVSSPISPHQLNQAPVSDLPLHFSSYSPASSVRSISSPATILAANSYWDSQLAADQQHVHNVDLVPQGYPDSVGEDFHLQEQLQFLSLEDPMESVNSVSSDFSNNYYYPEPALGVRTSRRSPSMPEFPVKICHYFNKGFCKHGNNCRYFHGHPMGESFSQIFNSNSSELSNDDHAISPGSLEKLEVELTELLKSRRGFPVSIASLPMMYYEKFGRTLQAEGYLTESQRHGKAGYSLTKLLSRLKNRIRVIDRPHGQHSVILAEDFPRYLEYTGEKNDPGGIVAGSRQIYLTFPAESSFTEQDVSNYFNKFGPVQDVRIPCQQKRMFGFVTFVYPETVRQILSKGNPHFVCGARVLVKPYREKSRLVDRKFLEKIQPPMCCSPHFIDGDSEFHSMPRVCDHSRLLRKQLIEENEQAFELERRCLSELQLGAKPLSHRPYYGYSMDDLKLPEASAEQADFPSAERFNYLMDVFNNGSSSEDKLWHINTNYKDQDSGQGLNLPESPFASSMANGISTVI
ncbi:zinc finger CCCH domain-containing protein 18 [Ziziphus jujuba]|uniref:Zinc finger CCCH domain-containing protein 18 n=1 Tax=Ziziphus jujuba TaxID=326968 RepID=A0ABM4A804_ZIZJJ|nr:zinc finger CCCH domain-containing protein 18 [Ziziphus jujuba]XP_048327363.1 zinc finger CCCH domain-containing protein 18 [Ziziphus jujuba var. spinosa]XP_060672867.1 zinc finger CCCH domain-containing protein 18 [Ziziphus jujuba]